eukprot:m.107418 g.107418  ORF g.107418 m.107418 type:complete len:655 (+) comp27795_c1_seq2:355-2319(+)
MAMLARSVCWGALAVGHLAGQRSLSCLVSKRSAINVAVQSLRYHRQGFRHFSQSTSPTLPAPKSRKHIKNATPQVASPSTDVPWTEAVPKAVRKRTKKVSAPTTSTSSRMTEVPPTQTISSTSTTTTTPVKEAAPKTARKRTKKLSTHTTASTAPPLLTEVIQTTPRKKRTKKVPAVTSEEKAHIHEIPKQELRNQNRKATVTPSVSVEADGVSAKPPRTRTKKLSTQTTSSTAPPLQTEVSMSVVAEVVSAKPPRKRSKKVPNNKFPEVVVCQDEMEQTETVPNKKSRKTSTKKPRHKLQSEKDKEKRNNRETESVPPTNNSKSKSSIRSRVDVQDDDEVNCGRPVPGPLLEGTPLWTGRTSRIVNNIADEVVASLGNLDGKTVITIDPASKNLLEAFLKASPAKVVALCLYTTPAQKLATLQELQDEHENVKVYTGDIVNLDWSKMSANITTVDLLKDCPRVPRDVQAHVVPFFTIFSYRTTRLVNIMMMKLHENVGLYQWGRVDTYMLMPTAIAEVYTRPDVHTRQALIVKTVAEVECVAEFDGDSKDPLAKFKLLRFRPILKSHLTVEIVVLAYLARFYHTVHGGKEFQQVPISKLLGKLCPGGDSVLEIAGVDPHLFPCQLTVKEHADIANAFRDYKYAPLVDDMGHVA